MKAASSPDTLTSSHAAANQAATNGIAIPAVANRGAAPQEEIPTAEVPFNGELTEPLLIDMDGDGEDELHTLIMDTADGQLWLHSDKETLELFLRRKRSKHARHMTPDIAKLLNDIEVLAKKVHVNTYGTTKAANRISKKTGLPKKSQHVAATKAERIMALGQLREIAGLLKQLNAKSADVMKKVRPPSHKEKSSVHTTTDGDTFCKEVVMHPLSLLPRDDGVMGSAPTGESKLFTALNKKITYIRGHMLNDHLHGPGTNDNLVPISTPFNSLMKTTVEAKTKEAVNANNKVVRFEVETLEWGAYKGFFKGTFLEENKLPAKFRFLVQQLERDPTKDGSETGHWKLAAKSPIFSETLVHTIPTSKETKSGTMALVPETFIPGYYFSATGTLKEVPPDYHLSGKYFINGSRFDYLFEPFGLNKSTLFSKEYDLEITTAFKMPAGYELIPIPQKPIAFIHNNNIHSTTTPEGQSFLIAKKTEQAANEAAYAVKVEEVRKAKEDEKLALEKKKKAPAPKVEVKTVAELRKERYLRDLEPAFNAEVAKYLPELNPEFGKRFAVMQEGILSRTVEEWKKDPQLSEKKLEDLLAPLKAQIVKDKNALLIEQGKADFVLELLNELNTTINSDYRAKLTEDWQKRKFDAAAKDIFDLYKKFWRENQTKLDLNNREVLLKSAYAKLDAALKEAQTAAPIKRKSETDLKTEDTGDEKDKKPKIIPGPFVPNTNISTSPQRNIPRFQPQSPPVNVPALTAADRETADELLALVASVAHGDPALLPQMGMLTESIQEFLRGPNAQTWENVYRILGKCKSLKGVEPYLMDWAGKWESMSIRST
ncbi:hypothetical protein QFZ51_003433 [Chitinophaga sp. W3I9]|uniref:hypothetical protein n=1 Tax=Chitinophaga sp. W3I9 TaxID=3373924 RepID=UPI003D23C5E1